MNSHRLEERDVLSQIPLFQAVSAGFASPAEDHYEEPLNLNSYLIKNPSSTLIYHAIDNSMFSSGILEGDILVAEKSAKNPFGKIVIVRVGEEIHIKRLSKIKNDLYLTSDSLCYSPLKLDKETDFEIVGIVNYSIHNLLNPFDYEKISANIDLHSRLVRSPVSTFFVRVAGKSMINAGIFDKDILIVDRAIFPSIDNVVVAYLEGGFTVKRLKKKVNFILFPENDDFPSVELTEQMDSRIWGVVTYCIHKVS